MEFKSKRTIIGLAAAVILFIGYIFYAVGTNAPASDDAGGWALLMLKFIIVCIIAEIIIHVIIHAAFAASVASKEKGKDEGTIKRMIMNETRDDEMDKRITLVSSHVGYGVVGVGFVITLIAMAFFSVSAILALNIMLGIFLLSVLADSCVSIYMY
ncbi:MAG: hypothetical protein FWG19_02895, partial [Methanomassiliicoccaceae archaeon]|nr:hypothetical protein [Methanomassiliicoccaceae archaeon]